MLGVMLQVVNQRAAPDPAVALEYVFERAWRAHLTDSPITGSTNVDPMAIAGGCVAVARDQFGAEDERTTRLLARLSGDARSVARVLLALVTLESAGTRRALASRRANVPGRARPPQEFALGAGDRTPRRRTAREPLSRARVSKPVALEPSTVPGRPLPTRRACLGKPAPVLATLARAPTMFRPRPRERPRASQERARPSRPPRTRSERSHAVWQRSHAVPGALARGPGALARVPGALARVRGALACDGYAETKIDRPIAKTTVSPTPLVGGTNPQKGRRSWTPQKTINLAQEAPATVARLRRTPT